ncbi:MAG: hypothetical protein RSC93_11055 [Erysipelotrichaceae bacterium]
MKILCLIGQSGSGKTTIGNYLKTLGIPEIVSYTTRKPREGEKNGETYYFVSKKEFDLLDKVESVEYAGNFYGTSKGKIEEISSKSNLMFAIVTLDGFEALKKCYPNNVVSVYVHANRMECITRMILRGDSEENIKKRISNSKLIDEAKNADDCDYAIHNDNLENAKKEIIEICKKLK